MFSFFQDDRVEYHVIEIFNQVGRLMDNSHSDRKIASVPISFFNGITYAKQTSTYHKGSHVCKKTANYKFKGM